MKAILSMLLCLAFTGIAAQCTAAGPFSGTSFSDVNTGSYTFSNPSYLASSDNNRASAAALLSVLSGNTDQLQASGFNFNIPSSASICGIEVAIEKRASNITLLATVSDHDVRLLKAGATTGNNKADPTDWSTTESYITYGASNDLWGSSWSAADINDPNFGVSFSAGINGLVGVLPIARVNHVQLTVYYTTIVLPLSQLNLTASYTADGYIKISWQNTAETKVALQRSIDGHQWATVYTGNADHFTDYETISNTRYYYRTTADNKQYSKIIEAICRHSSETAIYPNPSTDFIITNEPLKQPNSVAVVDTYGHTFRLPAQSIGNGRYKIIITSLQQGVYCLQGSMRKLSFMKRW